MLDLQAQALLRLIQEKNLPPTHTVPHTEAREYYRLRRGVTQPEPPQVGEVRELRAPGPAGDIPLRLYRPRGASPAALPVLVYYHGGGWTIGDLDTHDTLCRQLANGSGCAVVAVDYRLGPEHRFPSAVDDAMAAARWVHAQAKELGLDASRLAVGGDSAGGNLAAVVALLARDDGGLPIRFQLLIYPATDQRHDVYPSRAANGKGYLLEKETMDWFHDHYIDDPRHDLDWRASPMLHPDHAGLPPAFVLTAGYDPLRDEGVAYAQKLNAAGSPATLVSFERQIHGFILMGKVIEEANTAVRLCAAELRHAL